MYLHIKPDHIMPGLPAGPLDKATLTPYQQTLLDQAVNAGIYREVYTDLATYEIGIDLAEYEDEPDGETSGN